MNTPKTTLYLVKGFLIEATSQQEAEERYLQVLNAQIELWRKEHEEHDLVEQHDDFDIAQWERDQEERIKEEQIADELMIQWYAEQQLNSLKNQYFK